jgi:hypothetical protein
MCRLGMRTPTGVGPAGVATEDTLRWYRPVRPRMAVILHAKVKIPASRHWQGRPAGSAGPLTPCKQNHPGAPSTRHTFCPPNPNELEMACMIRASRATFGTQSTGSAGSGDS